MPSPRRFLRAYEQCVAGCSVQPAGKVRAALALTWLCLHLHRCTPDSTLSVVALQRASALAFSRHLPASANHDPAHQQAQLAVLLASAQACAASIAADGTAPALLYRLPSSALLVSLHNDAVCAAEACEGRFETIQASGAASCHSSLVLLASDGSGGPARSLCRPWACVVASAAFGPPQDLAPPPSGASDGGHAGLLSPTDQPIGQNSAAHCNLLLSLGVVPPAGAVAMAEVPGPQSSKAAGLEQASVSMRSRGALTSMHSGAPSLVSGGAGVASASSAGAGGAGSPWRPTAMNRSEDLYGFMVDTPLPTHNLNHEQREAAAQLENHMQWMKQNSHLVTQDDLRAVHLARSGRLALDAPAIAALAARGVPPRAFLRESSSSSRGGIPCYPRAHRVDCIERWPRFKAIAAALCRILTHKKTNAQRFSHCTRRWQTHLSLRFS